MRVQLHLPPLRSLDLLISPGTLWSDADRGVFYNHTVDGQGAAGGCGDLPTTRIEQRLLLRLEADRNVLPLRRVAEVKINCVVFLFFLLLHTFRPRERLRQFHRSASWLYHSAVLVNSSLVFI